GVIATGLVLEGELRTGDWISAGEAYGKVKSLEDFLGNPIKVVIASQPCTIMGWDSAPAVGQEFVSVASKAEAQKNAQLKSDLGPAQVFTRESGTEDEKTNKKIANLIIKADVQSSLEAIDQVLGKIHSEEVDYNVVSFGVGNINDADVKNAFATKSSIIGFHVSTDGSAKRMAEREDISVQSFDIIYELVEAVRSIMSDLLDPEIKRTPLGKMKILAVFKSSAKSQVIGGKVTQGKAIRGAMVDVIRNSNILLTGKLGQLQHNKADVTEVAEGLEAGIRFDLPANSTEAPILIKEGDILEIYQEEKTQREL
ncbi:MAG: hypothetical protein WD898_03580, partial [Candidatus Paceibacterota bacterium]